MKLLSVLLLLISNITYAHGPYILSTQSMCYSGTMDKSCYDAHPDSMIKLMKVDRQLSYTPPPEQNWIEDYFYTDNISKDKIAAHITLCILKSVLLLLLGLLLLACILFCFSLCIVILTILYAVIASILNIFLPAKWVLPIPDLTGLSTTTESKETSGPGFWTGMFLGGLFF